VRICEICGCSEHFILFATSHEKAVGSHTLSIPFGLKRAYTLAMNNFWLTWNAPVGNASRLQPAPWSSTRDTIRVVETALLVTCGIAAACAVLLLEFKWRLPGHAILRAVFPMALGMAMVPRRGVGTVIGLSVLATTAVILGGGWGEKGVGSLTSLLLIGPLIDLSSRWSTSGKRVYLALMSAGVVANLLAMTMQVIAKSMGWGGGGGKSLSAWLPLAAMTYPTFGIVAGLVSATALFKWRDPPPRAADTPS
jgi:hypothetical protein